MSEYQLLAVVLVAFSISGVLAFVSTPFVKRFAHKMGAIDVPKDNRRVHKKPIPRLGGLSIFFGFLVSVLIFVPLTTSLRGILIGAIIIVILGVLDDIFVLNAKVKFLVQILAAVVPVLHGVQIERFTNLNPFNDALYISLGWLAIPVTIFWIVGITNAVNLIDGLDGLAVGVSSIASFTLLAIGLLIGNPSVAIVMAALAGGCVGFMPYNLNPASIFMGDTGSTFLGFILATMSIQGLFKMYAIISFAVPFLILALPIFDTASSIIRRLLSGKSPLEADGGHVHHRLIDMGFNQKQSVGILYIISGVLGLSAVVLTSSGEMRAMLMLMALVICIAIGTAVFYKPDKQKKDQKNEKEDEHEEN